MKRRILTISLIVASLVLLVSVGFAGWVITGSMSDTKTGNFDAYAVDNQGQIIVSNISGDIKFGAPSSPLYSAIPEDAWFRFDNQVEVQSLSATFTVQLDGVSSGTFSLTPTSSVALDSKIIAGPTFSATGDATVNGSNQLVFSSEGTATVTVTYAWGDLFGGVNPYNYFYTHRADKSALLTGTDLTNAAASNLLSGDNSISESNNVTYSKLAQLAMQYIYTLADATFTVAIAKVNG